MVCISACSNGDAEMSCALHTSCERTSLVSKLTQSRVLLCIERDTTIAVEPLVQHKIYLAYSFISGLSSSCLSREVLFLSSWMQLTLLHSSIWRKGTVPSSVAVLPCELTYSFISSECMHSPPKGHINAISWYCS